MNLLSKLAPFAVRATPRAVWFVGLWTAFTFAFELLSLLPSLAWLGVGLWLMLGLGACLAGVLLWEYVRLLQMAWRMSGVQVERTVNSNLPVYETSKVTLELYVQNELMGLVAGYRFGLMDYYPDNAKAFRLPVQVDGNAFGQESVSEGGQAGVMATYELYARERGAGVFGGIDWLMSTPLGLLQKYHHTPSEQVDGVAMVRVLANFRALVQGNLLAVSKNTTVGGIIKRKRRGQGQDFHQIRQYTEGDSIRHVDWRATSRHQKLMSREYQDETDQEIMFLLDAGTHMRHTRFSDGVSLDDHQTSESSELAEIRKTSHLDMALNAMLLLAEVANKQADSVGFMSFGAVVDKIAPAKKGQNVISYLLNQSFDLQASTKAPDYMAIAKKALSTQKRRSLIIIITNLRTDNTDELMGAINLLTAKHRVILVNLYEEDLKHHVHDFADRQSIDLGDALTYHSVRAYLDGQRQLNIRLGDETGAMVVSSTPTELPQKLVDSYWAVRRVGAV
ncbi:DUF58 domain-containing protein [Moraxella equi]|uniref:Uncharacterized conserved protein (Some members contain a von Willebrand factor type A (VWA) domain) n=1 Tax=Moraxella equi TaxID=60442 RepID=A0A378QTK0_9GAMM|nr:DUF58 domain-containing protein [Moraxella equi]OPH37854.1 hypothetical protein B5J93_07705 [Moraxella equi]STZ04118.1 Uncharacterized conserved protein (some members contain a von Willebrand factor type A (vWA) domain) [Moraxella equi]